MPKFCREPLLLEANALIFCSKLQFRPWRREFSEKAEEQDGTGRSGSDSERKRKMRANIVKYGILFWRIGLIHRDSLDKNELSGPCKSTNYSFMVDK